MNLATNRAFVAFDPAQAQPAALIAAVEKAGYGAAPTSAAPKAQTNGLDLALMNLVGAAVLTAPVLVISMAGMGMARPVWTL